jgi:glycosyltransferase involved in cell wall biosynthesis
MKLSIAIPAYNEEALIGACLEAITASLSRLKLSPSEYEIVVVNNASTDHTKEIASSYPGVRVVDEPHKGLTRARQTGQNSTQESWWRISMPIPACQRSGCGLR